MRCIFARKYNCRYNFQYLSSSIQWLFLIHVSDSQSPLPLLPQVNPKLSVGISYIPVLPTNRGKSRFLDGLQGNQELETQSLNQVKLDLTAPTSFSLSFLTPCYFICCFSIYYFKAECANQQSVSYIQPADLLYLIHTSEGKAGNVHIKNVYIQLPQERRKTSQGPYSHMGTIAQYWVMDTFQEYLYSLPSPLLFHSFGMAACPLQALRFVISAHQKDMMKIVQSLMATGASKIWVIPYLVIQCKQSLAFTFKTIQLSFQMPYIYPHYLQGILSVLLIISIVELGISVTIASFRSKCWTTSDEVRWTLLQEWVPMGTLQGDLLVRAVFSDAELKLLR